MCVYNYLINKELSFKIWSRVRYKCSVGAKVELKAFIESLEEENNLRTKTSKIRNFLKINKQKMNFGSFLCV